jgi:hypothetical protein
MPRSNPLPVTMAQPNLLLLVELGIVAAPRGAEMLSTGAAAVLFGGPNDKT